MPLSEVGGDGAAWQYNRVTSGGDAQAQPVPVVTLASLISNAVPVTDTQVGKPCPADLPAVSVISQEQHDGSTDHHPAPTHVRFERAANPVILPAAVLAKPKNLDE